MMKPERRNPIGGIGLASCLAGLTLGLVACSDETVGPDPDGRELDAATVEADFDALNGLLESAEWQAYRQLADEMGESGIVAARAPAVVSSSLTGDAGDAALRLLAAARGVPLISPAHLGVTFVFDPATGQYTPDPDRAGAPANGVRFILYGRLPGSEAPDPANEIGHVDLVDEGATSTGIDLRLTGTANGLAFVDYGVSIEGDETSGSVSIGGFLSDGSDRLDFALGIDASRSGGLTTVAIDGTLEIASRDFRIGVSADGSELDDRGALVVRLDVESGAESLRIDASGDPDTIAAEFFVNGQLFATAAGSPEAPVIVGADGEALSQAELDVLADIIRASDAIFDFFEGLLEPAEGIILIAVIL